jgi:ubiquinone/menaquinone biosynthesis C-methylase UbiE
LSRQQGVDNALSQPSFPDLYERVLVPAIFGRYARDLIERARPIGPSARVLDLGCGTGIVARLLRERLGGAARISGVDANPGMIAKARALAPDLAWHEGNAMALPFADGSFDLVFCQQMLQFAPDRAQAVREMRRVLAPGGRLLVSTWRSRRESPLIDGLIGIAERHLGPSNDKRYSLADADAVRSLLLEAGFADVQIAPVTLTEHHAQFNVRMNAVAAGFELGTLSDDERERRLAAVEADAAALLARFAVDGGGYATTSAANVATATRPEA